MTIKDTLEETYTALSANKVRSGLTILGIVIGISSVIALVSVGEGATASIQSSIQSLGSNLIEITPGASRTIGFGVAGARGSAETLTVADANAIASQVQNVAAVAQETEGRYQVAGVGTNTNTTVDGVTPSYADIRDVQVSGHRLTGCGNGISIRPATGSACVGCTVVDGSAKRRLRGGVIAAVATLLSMSRRHGAEQAA